MEESTLTTSSSELKEFISTTEKKIQDITRDLQQASEKIITSLPNSTTDIVTNFVPTHTPTDFEPALSLFNLTDLNFVVESPHKYLTQAPFFKSCEVGANNIYVFTLNKEKYSKQTNIQASDIISNANVGDRFLSIYLTLACGEPVVVEKIKNYLYSKTGPEQFTEKYTTSGETLKAYYVRDILAPRLYFHPTDIHNINLFLTSKDFLNSYCIPLGRNKNPAIEPPNSPQFLLTVYDFKKVDKKKLIKEKVQQVTESLTRSYGIKQGKIIIFNLSAYNDSYLIPATALQNLINILFQLRYETESPKTLEAVKKKLNQRTFNLFNIKSSNELILSPLEISTTNFLDTISNYERAFRVGKHLDKIFTKPARMFNTQTDFFTPENLERKFYVIGDMGEFLKGLNFLIRQAQREYNEFYSKIIFKSFRDAETIKETKEDSPTTDIYADIYAYKENISEEE